MYTLKTPRQSHARANDGTYRHSARSNRSYLRKARGVRIVEGRAEDYRRLARECLRLVRTVATEEARHALIEMARVWARLADEAPRPLVQQQQQVQPKKDE